jgi:hypothetical protein
MVIDLQTKLPGQGPGQEFTLIVASLFKARSMQRHGDYNIGYYPVLAVAAAQNLGKCSGYCLVILILELVDSRPDGVIKKMGRRSDSVDGYQGVTLTFFTATQAQDERRATSFANWRLDKIYLIKTCLAEPLVRILAVHTSRRQHQIK